MRVMKKISRCIIHSRLIGGRQPMARGVRQNDKRTGCRLTIYLVI